MIEYSTYQKAIFQEVAEGKENVIVEALAGSGKNFYRNRIP